MKTSSPSAVSLVALLAAAVGACGSSRAAVPAAGSVDADTWIQSDLGTSITNLRTVEDIHVHRDTLHGVTDAVLPHVVTAYTAKGLSVTTVDPESRLVGSVQTRLRRTLDGVRLSRYLSCGSTVMGDRADRYEVYLTVVTQVEPLGVGTGVYTHVRASAVRGGSSGSSIRCQTRGRLEREILGRLQPEVGDAA